jgi:hypothetical protein
MGFYIAEDAILHLMSYLKTEDTGRQEAQLSLHPC